MASAQFGKEPTVVIHALILANQMHSVCPRRDPFQVRCDNDLCDECYNNIMDLTFVWSTNVGAVLMKIILQLLPLKNDCRHRGHHSFGNIGPDDIDWAQLTRNGGKLLNDQ